MVPPAISSTNCPPHRPAAEVNAATLYCRFEMATLSMGTPIPVSEEIARKCTRDALQFNPKHGGGQDVFDALVRQVDRIDDSYKH